MTGRDAAAVAPADGHRPAIAHVFEIKTEVQADAKTGEPTGALRYRWACSCGGSGPWRTGGRGIGRHGRAARSARRGGERHVAAMERGPSAILVAGRALAEDLEIRAILVAAGAPSEDLEQLVAACPSLDEARGYRPPPREAWCAACGGVRPCDAGGCVVCQIAAPQPMSDEIRDLVLGGAR